jgi:DDE superfamily endonuclease/Transposase
LVNYKLKYGKVPSIATLFGATVCVRAITSEENETAVQVQKKLKVEYNADVCPDTVRKALKEAGLDSVEKIEKPKLSADNIKARLKFARKYRDWTVDDWKRVIWSDETKINRFCSDGRSWCWIRDGESLRDRQVKVTVKHGGGSIKVWGCMTAHGTGFMCKINENLTKDIYESILKEELWNTIKFYELDPSKLIFQHDNDPKHKAKTVQQWLEEQPFETLEWPAQSPDLNPIETLWAILKRRLNSYEQPPSGMLELWERVETIWNDINVETCSGLIEEMPDRIEAVIKANGKWTTF